MDHWKMVGSTAVLSLSSGLSLIRREGRGTEDWILRGRRSPLSMDSIPEEEAAAIVKKERQSPPPFDRDRFYAFRNTVRYDAEIRRRHAEHSFESGPVRIEAISYMSKDVSWVCWFDGGIRAFRGSGLQQLEDLLVMAGEIWWG